MALTQTPTHVTIPVPMYSPRARGPNAHKGPYAHGVFSDVLRLRINQMEKRDIELVAEMIGLTASEFIRWTAVKSAQKIMEVTRIK